MDFKTLNVSNFYSCINLFLYILLQLAVYSNLLCTGGLACHEVRYPMHVVYITGLVFWRLVSGV